MKTAKTFTILISDVGSEAYTDGYVAALERHLEVMVKWLEKNQPDVFRRGIWNAIGESDVS